MTSRMNDCIEKHKNAARALVAAQAQRDLLAAQLAQAETAVERADAALKEARGATIAAAEVEP